MKKHLLVLLPWFLNCIGAALNVIVMTANSGMMPFLPQPSQASFYLPPRSVVDPIHITWYAGVHLPLLADWIQIHWLHIVASPGDLLVWLGEWGAPYCIGAWLALVWSGRKKPILSQAYDGVLYDRAARTAQPEPRLRLQ